MTFMDNPSQAGNFPNFTPSEWWNPHSPGLPGRYGYWRGSDYANAMDKAEHNGAYASPMQSAPASKTSAPDAAAGGFTPRQTSGFTQPDRGQEPGFMFEDGGAIPDPDQEDTGSMPGNDPSAVIDQVFGYLRKKYGVTDNTAQQNFADGGSVQDSDTKAIPDNQDDGDVTGAVTGAMAGADTGGAAGGDQQEDQSPAIPDNKSDQGGDHSFGNSMMGRGLKRLFGYVAGDGAQDVVGQDRMTPRERAGGAPGGPMDAQTAVSAAHDQGGMEAAAAQLQYNRKKYAAWRSAAAVAYDKQNPQQVGEYLSKAMDHMPDGMQVVISPRGDQGYLATLRQNDKDLDQVPLSQGAIEQLVKTKAGMFDGVYEKGAQQLFRSLMQNAGADTEHEQFLNKYPVYRAPAGVDQEKYEQAGAEFPMVSQNAQRTRRAQELSEKETEQEQAQSKIDATKDVAQNKNNIARLKLQLEQDKLAQKLSNDEQNRLVNFIGKTVPQFDATPQNIAKAIENARRAGIISGGPQTVPAQGAISPTTKKPPNAIKMSKDGKYFLDKYNNVVGIAGQ